MLTLFQPKPKLKEILPSNYIDIHSHVLPGIDDGAQNNDEATFIMEAMLELGFKKSITTPHTIKHVWDNSREKIIASKDQLASDFPTKTNQLNLECASEYFLDENFVTQFQNEDLLTLKDKHVLVEMSYLNPPIQLFDILFQLQLKGYTPVLAHPERYTFYHSNLESYDKLKKAGCLFQMNLLSSVGYYGESVQKIADYLLKNKLIDFVGSDIHHKGHILAFDSKIRIKSIKEFKTAIANNQFFE